MKKIIILFEKYGLYPLFIYIFIRLFFANNKEFDKERYYKSNYKDSIFNSTYREEKGLVPLDKNTYIFRKKNKSVYYQNTNKNYPSTIVIEYNFLFEMGRDIYKLSNQYDLEVSYYFEDKTIDFILLKKKKWGLFHTFPNNIYNIKPEEAYKILKKNNLINPKSKYFYFLKKDSLEYIPALATSVSHAAAGT